ncbi:MAG: hypothetical protein HUJ69_06710 [Lachnospiraceae bacterium]|nr:hypothetical protein [Lachnospiraceae bacterium]
MALLDLNDMRENRKYYYGLFSIIFIIICCLIGMWIGSNKNAKLDAFTTQLTEQSVPDASRLVTAVSGTNKGDYGTEAYACLILQSELSDEELMDFYGSSEYLPYKEGYTVSMQVYAVDEASLDTLKEAGHYEEEGGAYRYIYLYSAPQN